MPDDNARRSRAPLLVTAAVLVGLGACYLFWPAFGAWVDEAVGILTSGDRACIERWVGGFGWWGPVVVVLTMIAQMFLVVIPSWGLMIVCVLAYGPVWGSLLSVGGVLAASSVGYYIGHHAHEVTIDRLVGPSTSRKVRGYVDDYGLWAVIAARLAPFLSNDAISFVGGLSQMGYRRFMVATLVGITPLTLFIAFLGDDVDRLKTGLIVVSAVVIAGLVAYIVYDRRFRT